MYPVQVPDTFTDLNPSYNSSSYNRAKPIWFSTQSCKIANSSMGTAMSLPAEASAAKARSACTWQSFCQSHKCRLVALSYMLKTTLDGQNRAGQTLRPYSMAYAKRGVYKWTRAQWRLPLDYESPACAYLKLACWQRMLFVSLTRQAFNSSAKSCENVELPCLYYDACFLANLTYGYVFSNNNTNDDSRLCCVFNVHQLERLSV